MLSKTAEIHPQAAYSAYINGFQHKFNYSLRTLANIENYLVPIEEVLRTEFIPEITGGYIFSDTERILMSIPIRFGGLGLTIINKISESTYNYSREITAKLTENVIKQYKDANINKEDIRKIKSSIRNLKQDRRSLKIYSRSLMKLRRGATK